MNRRRVSERDVGRHRVTVGRSGRRCGHDENVVCLNMKCSKIKEWLSGKSNMRRMSRKYTTKGRFKVSQLSTFRMGMYYLWKYIYGSCK